MNVTPPARFVRFAALLVGAWTVPAVLPAQQTPAPRPVVSRITIEPASITLQAGQTVPVKVTAYDPQGNVVLDPPLRVSGAR